MVTKDHPPRGTPWRVCWGLVFNPFDILDTALVVGLFTYLGILDSPCGGPVAGRWLAVSSLTMSLTANQPMIYHHQRAKAVLGTCPVPEV